MGFKKNQIVWTFLLLTITLVNVIAFTLLQNRISSFLESPNSYPAFSKIINGIYPRFEVESQRLPPSFFLEKFRQVIYRLDLSLLLAIALLISIKSRKLQTILLKKYRSISHVELKQRKWLTVVFYLACIYYTYDWPQNLLLLNSVKALYKPVALLVWQKEFPSTITIYIVSILYFLFIGACLLHKNKFWASVGVAILFLYQLALLQSFEKTDHTYASFSYAIALLPLLHVKKIQLQKLGIAGIRLSIGFAYFFSALEKILVGGKYWLNGTALKSQLTLKTDGAAWLLQTPFPQIASILVIAFQFFFIFSIVSYRVRLIFIFVGILFHWGTAFFIDVGGYDSPWIFMYIFLIERKHLNPTKNNKCK